MTLIIVLRITFVKAVKDLKPNWSDFEGEIEIVLKTIENYYTVYLDEMRGGFPYYYFKEQHPKAHSLFEEFEEYVPESYNNYHNTNTDIRLLDTDDIQENKKIIISTLYKQLNEFNKCFYIFLKEFISKIKVDVVSPQISDLNNFKVLSFNYTDTFEKIYKDKIISTCYIHGNLKNNNIVLGIGEDVLSNTSDYLRFQKNYQRTQKNTDHNYYEWIPKEFTSFDDIPAKLHIWGHSLCSNDKGIIKDLLIHQNLLNTFIYYYDDDTRDDLLQRYIEMIGNNEYNNKYKNNKIQLIKMEEAKTRKETNTV